MKILNIYGQEAWHTEARIVGNEEGLLELRAAIDRAILDGKTTTSSTSSDHPLFASDGEGYEVIVECHNDEWGLAGGEESFWNHEESNPQYIILVGGEHEISSGYQAIQLLPPRVKYDNDFDMVLGCRNSAAPIHGTLSLGSVACVYKQNNPAH